ncbi:hypothetical protein DSM104443_00282 [Usitatibacter rugosus]|uniref:Uncharacterized protein n=1 Tax=Usitatibacter rugosus TaxID=2732067 RepID=A0A6M4GQB4_9PROT|nr:hypothetical protein [Usitatibacter rugosus]QJR09245.1 hypothetical protein DSM104443_00282 [Usitatibacter rugosus]
MDTIAKALIEQTRLLEEAEDPLDLDSVATILEGLAEALESATPEEVDVLRQTLEELMQAERKAARPRARVIEYYRTFLPNVGILK